MGAGNFNAGSGNAGFDPLVLTAATIAERPTSIAYNPTVRQFPTLATGDIQAMDPVDQAVLMAVTVEKGKIGSAPGTGIDLSRVRVSSDDRIQAEVTDAVTNALATLVSTGSVTLLGAPIQELLAGRVIFTVDYINLKAPGSPKRSLSVNG